MLNRRLYEFARPSAKSLRNFFIHPHPQEALRSALPGASFMASTRLQSVNPFMFIQPIAEGQYFWIGVSSATLIPIRNLPTPRIRELPQMECFRP